MDISQKHKNHWSIDQNLKTPIMVNANAKTDSKIFLTNLNAYQKSTMPIIVETSPKFERKSLIISIKNTSLLH